MADKWNHISHTLERENEEFQEAMRAQLGTARKEPKFQSMSDPEHY